MQAEALPPLGGGESLVFALPAGGDYRLVAVEVEGPPLLEAARKPVVLEGTYALLYDAPLSTLGLAPGPVPSRVERAGQCEPDGPDLELTEAIPTPDRIFELKNGAWSEGNLPRTLEDRSIVARIPNPCRGLLFTPGPPMPETSSTGRGLLGSTLAFAGMWGDELVTAWRTGDLLYSTPELNQLQPREEAFAGGTIDHDGQLHLIDRRGNFSCRRRDGSTCAALPSLPEAPQVYANVSIGADGAPVWAATDRGRLYRRRGDTWEPVMDDGGACVPVAGTCGPTESCRPCRVPMDRQGDRLVVTFRASGQVVELEGDQKQTWLPPVDPQQPQDGATVARLDEQGRIVVGTGVGRVFRLEPSGRWVQLGDQLQAIDALVPHPGGWMFTGARSVLTQSHELGDRKLACGAQTIPGQNETFALIPFSGRHWVIGDGDRDLSLMEVGEQLGPGCPDAIE
jgi:hypothetical protein